MHAPSTSANKRCSSGWVAVGWMFFTYKRAVGVPACLVIKRTHPSPGHLVRWKVLAKLLVGPPLDLHVVQQRLVVKDDIIVR